MPGPHDYCRFRNMYERRAQLLPLLFLGSATRCACHRLQHRVQGVYGVLTGHHDYGRV
jgi:hypothetical protein